MSNICFSSVFFKTPFFLDIGRSLELKGHDVFYMCPSKCWMDWLKSKGVENNKILDQSLAVNNESLPNREDVKNELANTEKRLGYTVCNMIITDRLLRHWDEKHSIDYLLKLYSLIKKFLKKNNIDVVIGEATAANDLLTSLISDEMGTKYYSPHTVRIPDDRFAFFEGRYQKELVKNKKPLEHEEAIAWAEAYIKKFREELPKPSYWFLNNSKPSFKLAWVAKFVKKVKEEIQFGKKDPTRFSLKWLVKKRLSEVKNSFYLKRVDFLEEPVSNEKIVVFPLHKQPESSVDVLADFHSDQLCLIRQISRSIPITHKLYIKEHSNALGDRAPDFYKEIRKLPNVRLISPYYDSYALLEKASLIITISGTMAFEAGLFNKPAITFSNLFFCDLPSVSFCSNVDDLPSLVASKIEYKPGGEDSDIVQFMAYLYENSYPAIFTDVKTNSKVLEVGNVKKVVEAIEKIL